MPNTITVEVYFKAVPAGANSRDEFGIKLLPRVKNFSALKANLTALPIIYLEKFARNGATKLGSFKSHDSKAPIFTTMKGANEYMTRIAKEIADGVNANAKSTTATTYVAKVVQVPTTTTVRPTAACSIG